MKMSYLIVVERGWTTLIVPTFKSQGECIQYVNNELVEQQSFGA
jgi:hypothetical protein